MGESRHRAGTGPPHRSRMEAHRGHRRRENRQKPPHLRPGRGSRNHRHGHHRRSRLVRLARQYHPRLILRNRRNHGRKPFRTAVGHGQKHANGLGPNTARGDDALRLPLLLLPPSLLDPARNSQPHKIARSRKKERAIYFKTSPVAASPRGRNLDETPSALYDRHANRSTSPSQLQPSPTTPNSTPRRRLRCRLQRFHRKAVPRRNPPRPKRPDQQHQVAQQDHRERQGRQKRELRPPRLQHVNPQHRGNQPSRQKPHHNLPLPPAKPAPSQPPRFHRQPARNQQSPKAPQRQKHVPAQASKFHQRPKQYKKERSQQKCQLAVKRQHLFMVMLRRTPVLGLDGHGGKPIRSRRRFVDMQPLAHHPQVRKRESKYQHRDQFVPHQRMGPRVHQ